MKFTTSRNRSWSKYPYGYIPKKWIEVDWELSEADIASRHFHNNYLVYDADVCGEEIVYYAFESGKYFRVEQNWWLDDNADDEWRSYFNSEVDVYEIDKADVKDINFVERDWLVVSKF